MKLNIGNKELNIKFGYATLVSIPTNSSMVRFISTTSNSFWFFSGLGIFVGGCATTN